MPRGAKPKVLLVTPWAPLPFDAGSRRIWTACKYLADRYDFILLTLTRPEAGGAPSTAAALWRESKYFKGVFRKVYSVPNPGAPEAPIPGGSGLPDDVGRHYHAAAREKLSEIVEREGVDLVHVEFDLMAPYVDGMRERFPRLPFLLTHHDMGSISLFQSYFREMSGWRRFLRLGQWWRRILFTREACRRFHGVVVLTEADRRRLARLVPNERIHVVPTGVDLEHFHSPAPRENRAAETLVYVGHYPHYPNEDAVLWFAREILPLIWLKRPGVRFQIVGSDPTPLVRALAAGDSRIEVTGTVDDVLPYEAAATVIVAPLRLGLGIKGKLLEAFAAGAPVVATTRANEGIRAVPERDLLLADSPSAFAAQTLRLLEDPALWERLAAAGRAVVERDHAWSVRADQLAAVYGRHLKAAD